MLSNAGKSWTKIFKLSNTECRALVKIVAFISLLCIVMMSTSNKTQPPLEPVQAFHQNLAQPCQSSYQLSTLETEKKTTKILLLAYARSGSSFTGELLSAYDNAAYFFEPFYLIKKEGDRVQNALESIFGCKDATINFLKKNKWQKSRAKPTPGQCKASNPRVIKTIRIHREKLEPWIYASDIKVVHLIRDPRGMLNSIEARTLGTWASTLSNATFQCNRMVDDFKLEQTLPSDRYYRVRYEDLALNTVSTLRLVYKFLGLEFTSSVNQKAEAHVHAENEKNQAILSSSEKRRLEMSSYYNTFKKSGFDPNSWKKKLHISKIRDIEGSCQDLMKIAGYQTFF